MELIQATSRILDWPIEAEPFLEFRGNETHRDPWGKPMISRSPDSEGHKILPNLFIVGATKSGTTSLYHYLRQHPEVFMSVPKEPHFFSTDMRRKNRISEEEYFRLFADVQDKKCIGEASTEYLRSKEAAANIKSRFPNAKIVIMLRNPIEKIYSGHGHRLWRGYEDIEDFQEALKRGLKERRRTDRDFGKDLPSYMESGMYTEHVRRYMETFGRENVFVIIFDDFVTTTRKVFDELCEFLGIETGVEISFQRHNIRKAPRIRTLWRLTLPSSRARRLGKRSPNSVARLLRWLAASLTRWNTKFVEAPPMSKDTRNMLEEVFEQDIHNLTELLRRDLASLWLSQEHAGCNSKHPKKSFS